MKMKKQFFLVGFLTSMAFLGAQSLADFDQAMSSGTTQVRNIVNTVLRIIYLIGGVSAMVFLFTALIGGRDGDEKTKKFGTWLLVIAFISLGIFIIEQIFFKGQG